jgi:tellurite resistance protein TerC
VALVQRFDWIFYIFGGFLIFTGAKLCFEKEKEFVAEENAVLRVINRVIPIDPIAPPHRFFVHKGKKLHATPLFAVLLLIEASDVIFALDSIPAVLAISTDSFIVYTSNIFAILGLRSLFFAVSGMMDLFQYLKYGVSIILVFVGVKMTLAHHFKIPIVATLAFIALSLLISIGLSIIFPTKHVAKK